MNINHKTFLILILLTTFIFGFTNSSMAATDKVQVNLQVGDVVVNPNPTTPGNGGGSSGSEVKDVQVKVSDIIATTDEIRFSWEANQPVTLTLRWGLNGNSSSGASISGQLANFGRGSITNLRPNTQYWLELVFANARNQKKVIQLPVKTISPIPASTIESFNAIKNGTTVNLNWSMGGELNQVVRVVRSDIFIPRDPLDGEIIYEGRSTYYSDTPINPDKTYYYSIFIVGGDFEQLPNSAMAQVVYGNNDQSAATSNSGLVNILRNVFGRRNSSTTQVNGPFISSSNQNKVNVIQGDELTVEFCNILNRSCKKAPLLQADNAQDLALTIDTSRAKTEVDIFVVSITPADLMASAQILLLFDDDGDGVWQSILPQLDSNTYDYVIQAFNRSGAQLYYSDGVIQINQGTKTPETIVIQQNNGLINYLFGINLLFMASVIIALFRRKI